jgi:hypothetical protein
MKRRYSAASAFVGLLIFAGCHSRKEAPVADKTEKPAAAAESPNAEQSAANSTSTVISAARASLKEGAVDEAAAKLAQLQIQRAVFNAQQAKDYRQALSEAYDHAIEAAQRGDPRAQAALQLLRAAAPR